MKHELQTDRLVLRELTGEDVSPAYVAWLNDPEVSHFLETRHNRQDEASVRAFVETVWRREDEFLFGMFLRDGGRHVGNIKVGPVRAIHRTADVSLFLGDRAVWGRGLAAEAIAALSRYALETLGIRKLSASMYAANEGSRRAFLKAGYQPEGLRRAHAELDGARSDIIELGLLPDDLD